jgi:hypothetical protein
VASTACPTIDLVVGRGESTDAAWARLLEYVQVKDDAMVTVRWAVPVDSIIDRAHQHAAGARK